MRSRILSAGVIVAGLLSSATLSVAASGCSPAYEEAAVRAPANNAGNGEDRAAVIDASDETPAAPDKPAGELRVALPPPSSSTDTDTDTDTGTELTTSPSTSGPETTTTVAGQTTEPDSTTLETIPTSTTAPVETTTTTARTATTGQSGSGVVGQRPDGVGNPAGICLDGVIQPMADDASCGYADIGGYCLEQINYWRAKEGLEPFVRLEEFEACAAREARLALEAGKPHFGDDCGWRAQASSGGGRGGDGSNGTIEKSVWWLPKLIFDEGPEGGHYQGMMTERVRGVSCGYFSRDRDEHRIIINYYEL